MSKRPNPRSLHGRKQRFVRGEIWNAAIDLFADKGYGPTTVEEIAAAAGVSRRTFFRYFSSKDDVMVQAIDTYGDLLTEAIHDSPRLQHPLQVVKHAVLRVAEFVVVQPRARKAMQVTENSAAARGAQLSEFAVIETRVAAEFATAIKGRTHNPYTARILASLTFVLLNLTFKTWYAHSPARVADTVDEVFAAFEHLTLQGPGRTRSRSAR
jgi:AcrR family transcriptional regulator